METKIFKISSPEDSQIAEVGKILRKGGLAAIPTETVYGLAGNALSGDCAKKIFKAKGRPSDNPLIVHISEFSQWAPLVKEIPETAKALSEAFWPGPLTVILPKSDIIPDDVSGGLSTVAVRMPSDEIARAIIEGAALLLKDNLELLEKSGLKAEKITMIGGISNSEVCVGIVSQVLERPIRVSNGQGAGAVGACLLAGIGIGIYENEKQAYKVISK